MADDVNINVGGLPRVASYLGRPTVRGCATSPLLGRESHWLTRNDGFQA